LSKFMFHNICFGWPQWHSG